MAGVQRLQTTRKCRWCLDRAIDPAAGHGIFEDHGCQAAGRRDRDRDDGDDGKPSHGRVFYRPHAQASVVLVTRRAADLGLVVALPACATGQEWIYEKPNVTPAQLDRDKTACRKAAPSRSPLRIVEEERVNRDLFNRCMEGRGYTVKVVPLP